MKIDDLDRKILMHLQQDSKKTNKEISNDLGLSVTAIYERIRKLEREDVISQYVALINPESVEKGFMVLCQIKLIQHKKEFLNRFEKEITSLPEVIECLHVSGDFDYMLKVQVKDMDAYREFLVTKLTTLNHIGSTKSIFTINKVKQSTLISL
ncbi:Lrp/AsnC family transcriptional regulator [Christiangramia forsetii]|uniref:AsnC/Lrp family transcriptional regulator protein n=2 Tax=Christiangramia forsetii TaxID=411153 RepID=A0M3E4_CHRFK|nr:Lrp/AsnC family transcriptional regulator [Christiangramia forsetii]GGG26026.1 AsnC family transcriptional regulator [Christiangramia forsetii]CAL67139.1 AsnC/Lrp family transcriptional regulator protein [Christiangramia forsetii KT0803]